MPSRTVLVADDDPVTRQVLSVLLDLEDVEVVLAEDGDEALDLIRRRRPDAAVLDHRMPGRTGLEVLAELAAEAVDVPVIILTGVQAGELAADPVGEGARAHLEKPFSPLHLLEVLESLLGSRA